MMAGSLSPGANVWGNTVRENGGYGILLRVNAAYRGNVISDNTTGTVFLEGGSAVNAGGNVCNGSLTCP